MPRSFTARPATPGDADAVFEVVAACELADDGAVEVELEDVVADWARPSFDLPTESLVVLGGDRIVAEAEVFGARRAEANVHPDARARGIGRALLRWTEDLVRAAGRSLVGQVVTDNNRVAAELLVGHGYEPRWTSWILRIRLDAEPSVPELSGGLAIREFVPGADDRAVYRMIEDAFDAFSDRVPVTFEDWAARNVNRKSFDPALSPLVVDGGRVVGAAIGHDIEGEGWVEQLAVDESHRRRGIGHALLQESFRRFYRRGRRTCGLSTSSAAGALGFYERAGLRVDRSYTHYAKELTPA